VAIRQSIDIEALVSWALDCTGRLPWLRDDPRDLAMGRGLTARPRRRDRTTWAQVEAYSGVAPDRVTLAETWEGLTVAGHPLAVRRQPGDDAQLVLQAIQQLPPATAALVLVYGRKRCRPDWLPDVVPERVTRSRRRGRHSRTTVRVWVPCSPQELMLAREAYSIWRSGLKSLADALEGRTARWTVLGPRVPAEPWTATGGHEAHAEGHCERIDEKQSA
jgi:hypothetical protein